MLLDAIPAGVLTRAPPPPPQVPEVPLVVSDAVESMTKTSKAVELLQKLGAYADVEKSKDSKVGDKSWVQAAGCME